MRLLIGHSQEVAECVARMIPRVRDRGFSAASAIGVLDDDGRLVGGFVYHNWDPEAGVIEFSGAATNPRWLTRPVLHALFSYPFDQLGCQMVVTQNAANNTRLHRQLRTYGFREYPIPRLWGRETDAIVWTLTSEDWRANPFNRKQADVETQGSHAS